MTLRPLEDIITELNSIQLRIDHKVTIDDIDGAATKLLDLQTFGGRLCTIIYETKRTSGLRQKKEWDDAIKAGYKGNALRHYLENIMEHELTAINYAENLFSMNKSTGEWLRTVIALWKQDRENNKPIKQS